MSALVGRLAAYLPYAIPALTAGVVLLKWPFAGLVGIVALIPGEELTTFLAGRTMIWFIGIGVLAAWALRSLLVDKKIQIAKRPTLLALLWLAWGLVSVFWAQDQSVALSRAVVLAQLIAFFFLLQVMVTDDRRLRVLVTGYFAASVFFALLAAGSAVSADLRRAVVVEAQNPNALARALGLALLMAPYLLSRVRASGPKLAVVAGTCALALAILLTGARGAWLGLVGALGFTWVMTRGRLVRARSILAAAVLLVVGIVGLHQAGIIDDWMTQRILNLPDFQQAAAPRLNIWAVGWEMVRDKPLTGIGLHNFPTRFEDYIDAAGLRRAREVYPGRDPHSIFLSIQSELGIIGLAAFLVFAWSLWAKLAHYHNDPRAMLGMLVLAFMLFSGFTATIQYRKFFWLALGLAAVCAHVMRREKA